MDIELLWIAPFSVKKPIIPSSNGLDESSASISNEAEDSSNPFEEGMMGFLTENGAIQSNSISIE